jgi:hypothetical protein
MNHRKLIPVVAGIVAAAFLTGCNDCDRCTNVVQEFCPPPVPAGVYSVTGDGLVQVYWTPVQGAGVSRYGVYRSFSEFDGYQWIADVTNSGDPYHFDRNVENGTTYFYAVTALNEKNEESDLSYETVADTPRPAGAGLVLYHDLADPDRAGIDFSNVTPDGANSDDLVVPWDDELADFYMILLDGLPRLVPTWIVSGNDTIPNLIQDYGYTYDFDEIGFATDLDYTYSYDLYGVELLEEHTYVIWTWDDRFAKIRVTRMDLDNFDWVEFEWAYQTSRDPIERMQLKRDAATGGADSARIVRGPSLRAPSPRPGERG